MLNKRGRILLVSSALWYFGEGMFGPLFAVFAQDIGGNILDVTSAWAVFLVATGICTFFVGRIADHFQNRRGPEIMLVCGYALNAALTFAYIFVSTPTQLFWIQAGLGIAVALSVSTWLSLYSQSTAHGKSASAWSLESALQKFVDAGAIVIGGYIVTHYSFETLFLIMGCIQVVATLYQARILWAPRN
jgi:MFS family permease